MNDNLTNETIYYAEVNRHSQYSIGQFLKLEDKILKTRCNCVYDCLPRIVHFWMSDKVKEIHICNSFIRDFLSNERYSSRSYNTEYNTNYEIQNFYKSIYEHLFTEFLNVHSGIYCPLEKDILSGSFCIKVNDKPFACINVSATDLYNGLISGEIRLNDDIASSIISGFRLWQSRYGIHLKYKKTNIAIERFLKRIQKTNIWKLQEEFLKVYIEILGNHPKKRKETFSIKNETNKPPIKRTKEQLNYIKQLKVKL